MFTETVSDYNSETNYLLIVTSFSWMIRVNGIVAKGGWDITTVEWFS